ncbi:MAG: hypothetical protein MK538_15775 [Planctomycetes bacterium]|nr:hypothetical protein [Planctomycetota bacterium]
MPIGDGDRFLDELGRARLLREGDAATVVAYGRPVHDAMSAAATLAADGVEVAVLDLRTLMPLDEQQIIECIERTNRVLIVHEAPLTCGCGSELAAWIVDRAFEHLDAPVRRLTFPDHPVPFNKALESAHLPDAQSIESALRDLVSW